MSVMAVVHTDAATEFQREAHWVLVGGNNELLKCVTAWVEYHVRERQLPNKQYCLQPGLIYIYTTRNTQIHGSVMLVSISRTQQSVSMVH